MLKIRKLLIKNAHILKEKSYLKWKIGVSIEKHKLPVKLDKFKIENEVV